MSTSLPLSTKVESCRKSTTWSAAKPSVESDTGILNMANTTKIPVGQMFLSEPLLPEIAVLPPESGCYPRLYQENPFEKSLCRQYVGKPYSFTDSYESYRNAAYKEMEILLTNGRLPNKELVLHFLKEMTVAEIKAVRNKIFRILCNGCKGYAGLTAVANIELTRGANGVPNNRVHYHILRASFVPGLQGVPSGFLR